MPIQPNLSGRKSREWWNFLRYDATIKLQAETLTPEDLLKVWKEMIFQLDREEGSIAKDMVEALRAREMKLLNNRFVVAAVWVDARYRILLTSAHKETAKAASGDI